MNIKDEIQREINRLKAAHEEYSTNKEYEDELRKALEANKMGMNPPVLLTSSKYWTKDWKNLIRESIPLMTFNSPKIIKTLPNGITYVRQAKALEKPDMCSFDLLLNSGQHYYDDSSSYADYIWFFNDGSVSYVHEEIDRNNVVVTTNRIDNGVNTNIVRQKIIESLAKNSYNNDSNYLTSNHDWNIIQSLNKSNKALELKKRQDKERTHRMIYLILLDFAPLFSLFIFYVTGYMTNSGLSIALSWVLMFAHLVLTALFHYLDAKVAISNDTVFGSGLAFSIYFACTVVFTFITVAGIRVLFVWIIQVVLLVITIIISRSIGGNYRYY